MRQNKANAKRRHAKRLVETVDRTDWENAEEERLSKEKEVETPKDICGAGRENVHVKIVRLAEPVRQNHSGLEASCSQKRPCRAAG